MISISTYSFKYLTGNTRVYPIMVMPKDAASKAEMSRFGNVMQASFIYTVPFKKRVERQQEPDVVNAVIAVTCPTIASSLSNEIIGKHSIDDIVCTPVEVELNELQHYTTVLRLPLVTVVNSYCQLGHRDSSDLVLFDYQNDVKPTETFEIYYYYRPKDITGLPLPRFMPPK